MQTYWVYRDEADGTTTRVAGPFDTFAEAHDYCRDDDRLSVGRQED